MPVLVVDDDPSIRATVVGALDLEGYEVLEAADGAEALRVLEGASACVILLDMRMPVMDGWAFAREYKARGNGSPVVVMTAAENARRWAEEVGAEGVLAKPFELDDLYAAVERHCGAAA